MTPHDIPGRMLTALALAGTLAVGACGDDDRLTEQQTAQRLTQIIGSTSTEVQRQFHPVFEQLGRESENSQVPTRVRAALKAPASAVARALNRAADRVTELDPPQDAEEAVDALAASAREQADRIAALPERGQLTVRELADAIQPPTAPLQRLLAAGIEVQQPGEG